MNASVNPSVNAPMNAPAPPPPLQGTERLLGTLAVSLATFMTVLDSSIANVSIPAIAGDLGASPSQGTWVITSFGIANAIAVPLTGWLTQRIGAVRLFVGSMLMFVFTSWCCGLAPTLELLVLARVLQGLSAGPLMPLAQTLLMASYPREKVGTALALWGMTTLVAPVAGPLLGGWITETLSWPWIFYINLPVGGLAAALAWSIYRHRETPRRKLPIDTLGLALVVLGVGALQLMLDGGKERDWFDSGFIIGLAIVAALALSVFVVWEWTEKHPVVDLHLFKGRNFTVGTVAFSLAYALFFGNVVLLPLWLQQWMGYSAFQAGMALAPVGILAIALTPVAGRKVATWDPRLMAGGAFAGFAFILNMRAQFTPQVDFAHILVPTVLQGAATAMFFIPLTTLIMSGQPPEKVPAAAGLSNFCRITGGAMGTSLFTTLWERRAALHHAHLTEPLHLGHGPFAAALQALQGAGLQPEQALAQVNQLINQQAYTRAVNDVFLLSSALYLLLIGVVFLARRPAPLKAAAVAID